MSWAPSKARPPTASEAASVSPSEIRQDRPRVVRLLPHQPPGRCTRKALPFAHEIHRLYAMGYTLEAIRQALSEVGVSVSRSTVHREATRRAEPASLPVPIKPAGGNAAAISAPSPSEFSRPAAGCEPSRSLTADSQRSKDIAEAFFTAHPSNPLIPTQETS